MCGTDIKQGGKLLGMLIRATKTESILNSLASEVLTAASPTVPLRSLSKSIKNSLIRIPSLAMRA